MSRLDDLTAETLDKLAQPGADVAFEIRQRLLEAWTEGQLSMRQRADEATKAAAVGGGSKGEDIATVAGALLVTEDFK